MLKYVLLLIPFFTLFGCKNKLTQFNIDYTSVATIPSNIPLSTPFNIYTPEQTTNSSFEFEINDTRKDLIREIMLSDLEITITEPEGQNFNFLKSIEVYIDSENFTERKIAFKENIESGQKKIVCDILDVDLQAYIKEDSFRIRLKTVTNQLITQDIKVDIYSNFMVHAKLLR